jgi:hypothetical protein
MIPIYANSFCPNTLWKAHKTICKYSKTDRPHYKVHLSKYIFFIQFFIYVTSGVASEINPALLTFLSFLDAGIICHAS